MMQRKLLLFCLALSMLCLIPKTYAQKGKSEFAAGYGFWSDYTIANRPPFNTSSGTFVFTYRYFLSKDVSLGLGLGYENITNWGSFVSICPELTVKYLDTRDDRIRVRLYGAVSYGVSILSDNQIGAGSADESGVKPYGFQATPIGARFGRQFGYFVELGYGYKGLVHAGAAFRFPRILAAHRHCDDCDQDSESIEPEETEKKVNND